MSKKLNNLKVAILATNGFEPSELFHPKTVFEQANSKVSIISLESGEIESWSEDNWGETIPVDLTFDEADANNFDVLQLPGNIMNLDKLRMKKKALGFVKSFFADENPVGAICHSPWTLIKASVISDRTITSWETLKNDLQIADDKSVDSGLEMDHDSIVLPALNENVFGKFLNLDDLPIEFQ